MKILKNYLLAVFFISLFIPLYSQNDFITKKPSQIDRRLASEEFRRGVQAYYRGTFNEAILLFEKALSYIPGEPLILDWLGKAYYSSGIEGAAISQWEFAEESGYGGMLLKNKIEVLKGRRNFVSFENIKYVEAETFTNKNNNIELFKQPLSATAVSDGSFWVTAYGTNELLHFDVNGIILDRTKGHIQGFDRPFDVIETNDGNLLVSEFAADRISLLNKDGKFISIMGKKGSGLGELIGPQFLTSDSYGNIYVSDFGNARIAVFSSNGTPLFNFGTKNGLFPGFTAPAGIAVIDDLIYAADALKGAIYVFDTAGNYIQSLIPEGSLFQIESLRKWNGNLVASAGKKAYLIDIAFSTITEIASLGNAPAKVTAAIPDTNGNLILIDYKNQNIEITSRINELAGGLFVLIKRVYADKFPNITVEVSVQNRNGQEIVGLKEDNFIITEGNRIAADYSLIGSAYLNKTCTAAIVLERSPISQKEKNIVKNAIKEIAKAMDGKGKIILISASSIPILEGTFFSQDLLTIPNRITASTSTEWKFDLALRLAGGNLINAEAKKAIFFLSFTNIDSSNFQQYSLNDLAAFMVNNNIRFYSIYMKQGENSPELNYLVKKTGGLSSYVYTEKGLSTIVEDLISKPIGIYQLNYKSSLNTDFGTAFLPVEVEVRLLKRSGRDEISYFSPLE